MTRIAITTPNAAFEERVRRALSGVIANGDIRAWPAPSGNGDVAAVTQSIVAEGADVVAVGPGVDFHMSIALAREFDQHHPEISVVLIAEPSSTLLEEALRAGVRDVIAPGAPEEELAGALRRGLETSRRRRGILADAEQPEVKTAKARIIMTLSPKGGAGKTTMSTNLAVGLARQHPRDVVLIDLDLQFGDVTSALRLMPEYTLKDACELGADLDTTSLKVFLTPHPAGLFVLASPEFPEEADVVTGEQVARVVETLANEFSYVIIDTDSGFSEAVLATIDYATDLVLVCATDVPTVRAMRKEIRTLDRIGANRQRRHVVLNRSDARVGLSRKDIESTVGVDVDIAVPSSRLVPQSLNRGAPVLESNERSGAIEPLRQLVKRFETVHGVDSGRDELEPEGSAADPSPDRGPRLWPFTRRKS